MTSPELPGRSAQVASWVQTVPGRHWFSYVRFHGPPEYVDRSWTLGDITAT